MPEQKDIAGHYGRNNLVETIQSALSRMGKTPATLTIDDLAPVEEFHIGGRQASKDFLDQLGFKSEARLLDVGCGIGGTARFVATRYSSHVTGIDATGDFVTTGNTINTWLRLDRRISLEHGSALDMPFADASFEGAYMLHVGMNIADKAKLASEVARVLKPGTLFGIYDVMRTGPGELSFPVPWASRPELSAVAEPDDYRRALEAAGFSITSQRNRRDFAEAFFADMRAKAAAAGGPPPLGLHLLMGETTQQKIANMVENVAKGIVAPVEMIARKT